MGGNHLNEHFRSQRKDIPTHDPYTGELNPMYEELTGMENPLRVKPKLITRILRRIKNFFTRL